MSTPLLPRVDLTERQAPLTGMWSIEPRALAELLDLLAELEDADPETLELRRREAAAERLLLYPEIPGLLRTVTEDGCVLYTPVARSPEPPAREVFDDEDLEARERALARSVRRPVRSSLRDVRLRLEASTARAPAGCGTIDTAVAVRLAIHEGGHVVAAVAEGARAVRANILLMGTQGGEAEVRFDDDPADEVDLWRDLVFALAGPAAEALAGYPVKRYTDHVEADRWARRLAGLRAARPDDVLADARRAAEEHVLAGAAAVERLAAELLVHGEVEGSRLEVALRPFVGAASPRRAAAEPATLQRCPGRLRACAAAAAAETRLPARLAAGGRRCWAQGARQAGLPEIPGLRLEYAPDGTGRYYPDPAAADDDLARRERDLRALAARPPAARSRPASYPALLARLESGMRQVPPGTGTTDRRQAAVFALHEAAHLVVAAELGATPLGASIELQVLPSHGLSEGHVRVTWPPAAAAEEFLRDALFALAGPAAEDLAGVPDDGTGRQDLRDAERAAVNLRHLRRASGRPEGNPEEEAAGQVRRLLLAEAATVERVAAALLEHGTLDAAGAAAVLDGEDLTPPGASGARVGLGADGTR